MSRLRDLINAYVTESTNLLKENNDRFDHFSHLIISISHILNTTQEDNEIYQQIIRLNSYPTILLSYYKHNETNIKQAINHFLTIMLCYELLTGQHDTKKKYHSLLSADRTSLDQFVVLTTSGDLKFLPKEVVGKLTFLKNQLDVVKRKMGLNSSFIEKQITDLLDFLMKYNLMSEIKVIERIIFSKLGPQWYIIFQQKIKSLEMNVTPIKVLSKGNLLGTKKTQPKSVFPITNKENAENNKSEKTPWHPFQSVFMLGWQDEMKGIFEAQKENHFTTSPKI